MAALYATVNVLFFAPGKSNLCNFEFELYCQQGTLYWPRIEID